MPGNAEACGIGGNPDGGMEITEDNLIEATEALRSHGVKEVIVTYGGKGVFLKVLHYKGI